MEELEKYEITGKRTVVRNSTEKKEYDVYEAKLTFKSGQTKTYNVFTEANELEVIKDEPQEVQEKLKKWFLVDRLLGKDGLIQQQDNNTFIYAGKIDKGNTGRYSGNPFGNIDENGITQKETFDKDLPFLRLAMEKSKAFQEGEEIQVIDLSGGVQDNTKKAKTYVISDVHGMYGSYMEAISRLEPQDTLFVLGDVIDRGKNGIKIIQDIIKRQHDFKNNPNSNPNVIFLCGNHELSFVTNLARLTKAVKDFNQIDGVNIYETNGQIRGQKKYDVLEIAKILCEYYEVAYPKGIRGPQYSMAELLGHAKAEMFEITEQMKTEGFISLKKIRLMIQQLSLQKKYKSLVELKQKYDQNITPLALELYDTMFVPWLINNGGKETVLEFAKLSEEEQSQVLDTISNSYVSYIQEMENKSFFLIHAKPPETQKNMTKLKSKNYTMGELSRETDDGGMQKTGYTLLKFVLEAAVIEEEDGYSKESVEASRKPFLLAQNEGLYTICGHSGVDDKIHSHPEDGFTMIDTRKGLALFCLDDESVEYIPDMEDIDRSMEIKEVYENIQKTMQSGIERFR